MTFTPMLACSKQPDLTKLSYPLLASSKLDGIRCIIKDSVVLSRTLKPIPNRSIQQALAGIPYGLDGELMVPGDYSSVESAVMSEDGTPAFMYFVFDCFDNKDSSYLARHKDLVRKVEDLNNPYVQILEQLLIVSAEEAIRYYNVSVEAGYEGIILRHRLAPYKYGRSTLKQEWMLKVKPVNDTEAIIVDFEELMHNDNVSTIDARGYTVRSKEQSGLCNSNMLGSLVCKDKSGTIVFIGSGFTNAQREEIWNRKDFYVGKQITFKYQDRMASGAYRFPVFKGFRSFNDV